MIKIAFDIDGTCVDLKTPYSAILFDKTGIDVRGCTMHDHCQEYGLPKKVVWEAIDIACKNWKSIPIYQGVRELMAKLYEHGREPIQFVTARPIRWATETHLLVQRFCKKVPFQISFTPDKLAFLDRYPAFAEDRRRTVLSLASAGKLVFMPIRTYNCIQEPYPAGIMPISGIDELCEYINLLANHEERKIA